MSTCFFANRIDSLFGLRIHLFWFCCPNQSSIRTQKITCSHFAVRISPSFGLRRSLAPALLSESAPHSDSEDHLLSLCCPNPPFIRTQNSHALALLSESTPHSNSEDHLLSLCCPNPPLIRTNLSYSTPIITRFHVYFIIRLLLLCRFNR